MRTVHRICAIIALAGLLFLAVSGVWMQAIETKALLQHAPETDPVIQAIREGMYGNAPYPVISRLDYTAATLPANSDYYPQALSAVLAAFQASAPGVHPEFIELRMANGVPIGQVGFKGKFTAFDPGTGAAVDPVIIRGAGPPPQLHETIKEWHRFWIGHYIAGFWLEVIMGASLWTLLITGLVVYFRLRAARVRIKRPQYFWFAGGWWRSLHRIVSVAAAVLLIAVAFSGSFLGLESIWGSTTREVKGVLAWLHNAPPPPDRRLPSGLSDDPDSVLTDRSKLQDMALATMKALRVQEPDTPVKVIRLRVYAKMKQGVVVTGGPVTRQIVFNTETGRIASLTEPGYPPNFIFGVQTHENMKHFHNGAMFGLTGRAMDFLAGFSLIYLCVSGLIMYFELWNRRRRSGRRSFLWT